MTRHSDKTATEAEFSITTKIARLPAKVSDATYDDRPVIEATVRIAADVVDKSANPATKTNSRILLVEFVGGYVGVEKVFDGDLEQFAPLYADFARFLYMAKRDQIEDLLENTFLANLPLPEDLAGSTEVAEIGTP
jgi:hypothetical protein